MSALRLALPSKGWEDDTLRFLGQCGLRVDRSNPRQYRASMRGLPTGPAEVVFQRATDIFDRLKKQNIPNDIAEVKGEDVTLQLRQENFIQNPADVYAVIWSAAGGFGDPLERDPEKVREDVVEQRSVSVESARAIYGVVIEDERLDPEATRNLRAERRAANRKDGAAKLSGKVVARVTDNLEVRSETGGLRCACAKCAADLGAVRENYKEHCVRREADISAANPNIGDYKRYIDDRPVFRQFFCPGCGALIENEIARAADDVLRDIELDLR